MNRLKARFDKLISTGHKALIPFITAGDPNPSFTVPLMHAMVDAGADIIELGVPFSDPMADGVVIQMASERALAHNMSLNKVLNLAIEFRKTDQQTPLVLMGYLNPIEIMGYADFANAAQRAEIDGVLTVDLPPEEAIDYIKLLKAKDIQQIFLLAPNSSTERIKKINSVSSGYLYYVALKGVTGAGYLDTTEVKNKLLHIREHTNLPVVVGFGIKSANIVKDIATIADGIVVGSALIQKIAENLDDTEKAKTEIINLITSMRQTIDNVV